MTNSNEDEQVAEDGNFATPYIAIARDGMHLLQQEVQLARQETIEKLTPAAQSTGMIVGGGLLAAIGSTYLADAIVRLLATFMPHWLASFLFGAGLTAGGVALIQRGTSDFKDLSLVPEKTINSLREDKEWLIHQIKSRLI
jgi:hypothetical protein